MSAASHDGIRRAVWRDSAQRAVWRDNSQRAVWRDNPQRADWRDNPRRADWRDSVRSVIRRGIIRRCASLGALLALACGVTGCIAPGPYDPYGLGSSTYVSYGVGVGDWGPGYRVGPAWGPAYGGRGFYGRGRPVPFIPHGRPPGGFRPGGFHAGGGGRHFGGPGRR